MHDDEAPNPTRTKGWLIALAVAGIAVAGVVVRLPGLAEPPLGFHPTRQYHGLIVARAKYVAGDESVPAEIRAAADAARDHEFQLEPPVVETITAAGYRVLGHESLMLGRLISLLSWAATIVAAFAIARRFAGGSTSAGVVTAAVVAFLPYGLEAGRSFQPDPPMVALMMAGIYLMLRWDERPSPGRFLAAAAVSALAIVVKAVAAPFLALSMFALVVARVGWRRAVTAAPTWGFVAIALVPASLYYVGGVLTGGTLHEQAEGSFIAGLLTQRAFWGAWAEQIGAVTSLPLAAVALVGGVLLGADRRSRLVLVALWLAYVVYGVAMAYRTATHDYYHLPLIPIVAIGVGVAVSRVPVRAPAVAAVTVVALALVAVDASQNLRPPRELRARVVAEARRAGDAVDHSTHVIFLAEAYGGPLTYHGQLAGVYWPSSADVRLEEMQGRRRLSVAARMRQLSREVDGAEWFVVTDERRFRADPELRRVLSRYPRPVDEPGLVVFDLRRAAVRSAS